MTATRTSRHTAAAAAADRRLAYAWLALCAAAGIALAFAYPDSSQQDGGHHFLGARWAWTYRWMLVDVWGRPLFSFLYSLPAQLGYPAAKLATVAVCVATAWQTWRLAEEEGLRRASLVVPFLFLQPAFLGLSFETMTEPLFALVFVVALRLHRRGHVRAGMAVASLMPLARPEGFFLCALWGVWVLLDERDARPGRHWWRRLASTLWLATGTAAWWLAALAITRDPLWIAHNWPSNWGAAGTAYGTGPLLAYWYQRSIIAGRLLYVPFLVGLALLLARRRLGTATSSFLLLFVLHSVLWYYGKFGSAGYARYFVCVGPATALITLAGWNAIAEALDAVRLPRLALRLVAAAVLAYSALSALAYVDSLDSSRDAWAVKATYERAGGDGLARERPVRQTVWSQAYMCIVMDCDPVASIRLTPDSARNVEMLRAAPAGTLVFWDSETGPAWFKLTAADVAAVGYEVVRSDRYALAGRVPLRAWDPPAGPRAQTMTLLYKGAPTAGAAGVPDAGARAR